MDKNMSDAELRVMDLIWDRGPVSAKELSVELGKTVGWNKNTTYTLIKRLLEKGAIERREPGFICRALVQREEVRKKQSAELVDKLFGGSASMLMASLLETRKLDDKQIKELRELIDSYDKE